METNVKITTKAHEHTLKNKYKGQNKCGTMLPVRVYVQSISHTKKDKKPK